MLFIGANDRNKPATLSTEKNEHVLAGGAFAETRRPIGPGSQGAARTPST
jgi:hypothetical protein